MQIKHKQAKHRSRTNKTPSQAKRPRNLLKEIQPRGSKRKYVNTKKKTRKQQHGTKSNEPKQKQRQPRSQEANNEIKQRESTKHRKHRSSTEHRALLPGLPFFRSGYGAGSSSSLLDGSHMTHALNIKLQGRTSYDVCCVSPKIAKL